ncbi:GNAT family N-acetyltransferase, partial [Rhizobium mongolense]
MVTVLINPFPSHDELNDLWAEAWGSRERKDFGRILARSLAHLGAYDGEHLIGFVNIAWDGG